MTLAEQIADKMLLEMFNDHYKPQHPDDKLLLKAVEKIVLPLLRADARLDE